MIDYILFYSGLTLIFIGGICDLLGSLGLLKFPNFYVRLHAATVGAIGGAVIPLIGVSLVALGSDFLPNKYIIAGASFITAIIILIIAPTGSHALAYAAHRAGIVEWKPKCDHLERDKK
ncbi:MAG: cation:proton antiporter [Desulfurococcales archaeon ex4484_58]|nr:MAG: cation:proton antiporter [Desulfurococcales archaeon ex4484_58]